MLKRLVIKKFKSLEEVAVDLPCLTVLFGPNAVGKSNFLDALQALSRIANSRTLSDAISEPIRGYPVEAFTLPPGGLASLLSEEKAEFTLEAWLNIGRENAPYQYRVSVQIQPGSGTLSVTDEYLTALNRRTPEPKGNPSIEKVDNQIRIRRKSKPANPRREPVGLSYAVVSDPRLGGVEYKGIEKCRDEMSGWRTYYLDPRVAMRAAKPPSEVRDIGVLGEDIAPFLYRLRAEKLKYFEAVKRTLASLVPGVEDLTVELDKRQGTLDVQVQQNGTKFSSRIVSEGTLRILALCSLAVNPWSGSLLAFEEPENGVHPRRLELIVDLLIGLAIDQGRQIIVTTHSPFFCDAVLKRSKACPGKIALLRVRHGTKGTDIDRFDVTGPLFSDVEIAQALTSNKEDGLFEGLILRGLIDE